MNCYGTFQPFTPPGAPVVTMTTLLQPIKTTPTTRPTTAPTPHKPEGKMKSKIEFKVQREGGGGVNRAFYFDAMTSLSFHLFRALSQLSILEQCRCAFYSLLQP